MKLIDFCIWTCDELNRDVYDHFISSVRMSIGEVKIAFLAFKNIQTVFKSYFFS